MMPVHSYRIPSGRTSAAIRFIASTARPELFPKCFAPVDEGGVEHVIVGDGLGPEFRPDLGDDR